MALTQNQRIQAQVNAIKVLRAKQNTNDQLQAHKPHLLIEVEMENTTTEISKSIPQGINREMFIEPIK